MKFAITAMGALLASATTALAGVTSTVTPVPSGGGDGTAGIVLLLMIGAVLLFNGTGNTGASQNKTGADAEDNDDDLIMRF